jgi:cytochrome c553
MLLGAVLFAWLVVGQWWPVMAVAEQAAARGVALAHACAACHGPDGRSQGGIPAIGQLSANDFAEALRAFRTDARQGTVMNRIARGLDDADISALAAYFASQQGR